MKNKTTLAFGAAVALSLAVPSIGFAANAAKDENRSVKNFTDISLMGSLDMDVTVGKKTSIKVIAPDDLVDKIITEVKGDTLKVHYEKHLKWDRAWNNKEIRVEVTMPDLKAASLLGSGDLHVTGGKGKAFDLALKGSGDATVAKSDYDSVEISLMGSGDISIDGQCDSISIGLMGSGDIDAGGLKCSDADVSVKGSGDAEVYANSSLEASVYGSGDVTVLGKPKTVDKTERGSGDVHIRR